MGPDAMILVFWMLSFKPTFSHSSFTFIKRLFYKGGVICVSDTIAGIILFLLFIFPTTASVILLKQSLITSLVCSKLCRVKVLTMSYVIWPCLTSSPTSQSHCPNQAGLGYSKDAPTWALCPGCSSSRTHSPYIAMWLAPSPSSRLLTFSVRPTQTTPWEAVNSPFNFLGPLHMIYFSSIVFDPS